MQRRRDTEGEMSREKNREKERDEGIKRKSEISRERER